MWSPSSAWAMSLSRRERVAQSQWWHASTQGTSTRRGSFSQTKRLCPPLATHSRSDIKRLTGRAVPRGGPRARLAERPVCYALHNAARPRSRNSGGRLVPPTPQAKREPYIIRSVVHAAQVLGAFQSAGEVLRLRDVVQRTGFGKGACFRLLHTLHHCGLVEKVDANGYRLISEIKRRKRYRLGYAAQGQDSSFPAEVHASLQRAAEAENIEL